MFMAEDISNTVGSTQLDTVDDIDIEEDFYINIEPSELDDDLVSNAPDEPILQSDSTKKSHSDPVDKSNNVNNCKVPDLIAARPSTTVAETQISVSKSKTNASISTGSLKSGIDSILKKSATPMVKLYRIETELLKSLPAASSLHNMTSKSSVVEHTTQHSGVVSTLGLKPLSSVAAKSVKSKTISKATRQMPGKLRNVKSSNKTDGIQIGTGSIAACENSKQSVASSATSLASPCLSVSANHSFVTNSSSALGSLVSASVCALSTTSVALSASSPISTGLPVATSVPSSSSVVSPATIVAASKFLPALTSFFSHQPAQSHKPLSLKPVSSPEYGSKNIFSQMSKESPMKLNAGNVLANNQGTKNPSFSTPANIPNVGTNLKSPVRRLSSMEKTSEPNVKEILNDIVLSCQTISDGDVSSVGNMRVEEANHDTNSLMTVSDQVQHSSGIMVRDTGQATTPVLSQLPTSTDQVTSVRQQDKDPANDLGNIFCFKRKIKDEVIELLDDEPMIEGDESPTPDVRRKTAISNKELELDRELAVKRAIEMYAKDVFKKIVQKDIRKQKLSKRGNDKKFPLRMANVAEIENSTSSEDADVDVAPPVRKVPRLEKKTEKENLPSRKPLKDKQSKRRKSSLQLEDVLELNCQHSDLENMNGENRWSGSDDETSNVTSRDRFVKRGSLDWKTGSRPAHQSLHMLPPRGPRMPSKKNGQFFPLSKIARHLCGFISWKLAICEIEEICAEERQDLYSDLNSILLGKQPRFLIGKIGHLNAPSFQTILESHAVDCYAVTKIMLEVGKDWLKSKPLEMLLNGRMNSLPRRRFLPPKRTSKTNQTHELCQKKFCEKVYKLLADICDFWVSEDCLYALPVDLSQMTVNKVFKNVKQHLRICSDKACRRMKRSVPQDFDRRNSRFTEFDSNGFRKTIPFVSKSVPKPSRKHCEMSVEDELDEILRSQLADLNDVSQSEKSYPDELDTILKLNIQTQESIDKEFNLISEELDHVCETAKSQSEAAKSQSEANAGSEMIGSSNVADEFQEDQVENVIEEFDQRNKEFNEILNSDSDKDENDELKADEGKENFNKKNLVSKGSLRKKKLDKDDDLSSSPKKHKRSKKDDKKHRKHKKDKHKSTELTKSPEKTKVDMNVGNDNIDLSESAASVVENVSMNDISFEVLLPQQEEPIKKVASKKQKAKKVGTVSKKPKEIAKISPKPQEQDPANAIKEIENDTIRSTEEAVKGNVSETTEPVKPFKPNKKLYLDSYVSSCDDVYQNILVSNFDDVFDPTMAPDEFHENPLMKYFIENKTEILLKLDGVIPCVKDFCAKVITPQTGFLWSLVLAVLDIEAKDKESDVSPAIESQSSSKKSTYPMNSSNPLMQAFRQVVEAKKKIAGDKNKPLVSSVFKVHPSVIEKRAATSTGSIHFKSLTPATSGVPANPNQKLSLAEAGIKEILAMFTEDLKNFMREGELNDDENIEATSIEFSPIVDHLKRLSLAARQLYAEKEKLTITDKENKEKAAIEVAPAEIECEQKEAEMMECSGNILSDVEAVAKPSEETAVASTDENLEPAKDSTISDIGSVDPIAQPTTSDENKEVVESVKEVEDSPCIAKLPEPTIPNAKAEPERLTAATAFTPTTQLAQKKPPQTGLPRMVFSKNIRNSLDDKGVLNSTTAVSSITTIVSTLSTVAPTAASVVPTAASVTPTAASVVANKPKQIITLKRPVVASTANKTVVPMPKPVMTVTGIKSAATSATSMNAASTPNVNVLASTPIVSTTISAASVKSVVPVTPVPATKSKEMPQPLKDILEPLLKEIPPLQTSTQLGTQHLTPSIPSVISSSSNQLSVSTTCSTIQSSQFASKTQPNPSATTISSVRNIPPPPPPVSQPAQLSKILSLPFPNLGRSSQNQSGQGQKPSALSLISQSYSVNSASPVPTTNNAITSSGTSTLQSNAPTLIASSRPAVPAAQRNPLDVAGNRVLMQARLPNVAQQRLTSANQANSSQPAGIANPDGKTTQSLENKTTPSVASLMSLMSVPVVPKSTGATMARAPGPRMVSGPRMDGSFQQGFAVMSSASSSNPSMSNPAATAAQRMQMPGTMGAMSYQIQTPDHRFPRGFRPPGAPGAPTVNQPPPFPTFYGNPRNAQPLAVRPGVMDSGKMQPDGQQQRPPVPKNSRIFVFNNDNPVCKDAEKFLESNGLKQFDPHNFNTLRHITNFECLVLVQRNYLNMIHHVPNLLRLKRDLRVIFLTYNDMTDVQNKRYTMIFPRAGMVIMDETALLACKSEVLDGMCQFMKKQTTEKGTAWKLMLSSHIFKVLDLLTYQYEEDIEENVHFTEMSQILNSYKMSGIVELMPESMYGGYPRSAAEYHSCCINLQATRLGSCRHFLFVTDMPRNHPDAKLFLSSGIDIMNIVEFMRCFVSRTVEHFPKYHAPYITKVTPPKYYDANLSDASQSINI